MTDQTRQLLLQLVDQATVSPAHPQAAELMAALLTARAELLAAAERVSDDELTQE